MTGFRSQVGAVLVGVSVALAAMSCAKDRVAEVAESRAKTSAEVAGFVVRDEPGGERRVVLDVAIRSDARPPLDGLTLDVSIAAAGGAERERKQVWVATPGLGPGGIQVSVPLEGVDYRPGDGYWVEVRNPVPAAERGAYREFGATGGADR